MWVGGHQDGVWCNIMIVHPNDVNLLYIWPWLHQGSYLLTFIQIQTNAYRHVLNINKCTACNLVLGLAVDKTVLRGAIIHPLLHQLDNINKIISKAGGHISNRNSFVTECRWKEDDHVPFPCNADWSISYLPAMRRICKTITKEQGEAERQTKSGKLATEAHSSDLYLAKRHVSVIIQDR